MQARTNLYLAVMASLLFLVFPGLESIALAQLPVPEVLQGGPSDDESPEATPAGLLDEIVETRTPVPTATPGLLSEKVDQLVKRSGLYRTSFLGLSVADWANLGISLLYVVLGYLMGTLVIRVLLPRFVHRTPSEFDDQLLEAVGGKLRWLAVLLAAHFGTERLAFVSAEAKALLSDIYFTLALSITVMAAWQAIDRSDGWYRERLAVEGRAHQLSPVITALVRIGRVVMVIAAVAVLLSHFGINVAAFAAVLGLGGLALSLAAKDTISDAISGFIILVDQPFRIGDRVEIQGVGTWGDVVDIGLRTTRIRTRDNRLVIVPNSVIGNNQVVNYTYPDSTYRIETHVGIAYGTDIETARQVLVDAVRTVEGVLEDQPVEALYVEMGDSAMVFRVRWWIESYVDTRRMFDQVHTALQRALDAAGIESPYPTQTFRLDVDSAARVRLQNARGETDDGALSDT
jgi:small-conductance mechanosensitive channel